MVSAKAGDGLERERLLVAFHGRDAKVRSGQIKLAEARVGYVFLPRKLGKKCALLVWE